MAVVVTRILLLLLSSSSLLLFLLKLCVNFGQSSVRIISRFLELRDTTDALPCHIHYPLCLSIMGPHSTALKKNTSHGNEDLIQRPCYQRGSPCQDPAGNRTTRRPPDHRKETQTAVVWSCLPFIRPGQNHIARHRKRGKKTRQTEKEEGRHHKRMDRPGIRQFQEGSGEQKKKKMEEIGCDVTCVAPNDPRN